MSKLTEGSVMPNFQVTALNEGTITLDKLMDNKKTIFIFLRFYGCIFSQLDIYHYQQKYEEITRKNAQIIAVLQSTPETLKAETSGRKISFPLICDETQVLYKALDIHPAANREILRGGNSKLKTEEARKLFSNGKSEGNPLQIPAAFIVEKNMTIIYARYGENGADLPAPEELIPFL